MCRGAEFLDSKIRDKYRIGSTWPCIVSATVDTPDGEIIYQCSKEFTRMAVNTVRESAGRVCLRKLIDTYPDTWEEMLCQQAQTSALSTGQTA